MLFSDDAYDQLQPPQPPSSDIRFRFRFLLVVLHGWLLPVALIILHDLIRGLWRLWPRPLRRLSSAQPRAPVARRRQLQPVVEPGLLVRLRIWIRLQQPATSSIADKRLVTPGGRRALAHNVLAGFIRGKEQDALVENLAEDVLDGLREQFAGVLERVPRVAEQDQAGEEEQLPNASAELLPEHHDEERGATAAATTTAATATRGRSGSVVGHGTS